MVLQLFFFYLFHFIFFLRGGPSFPLVSQDESTLFDAVSLTDTFRCNQIIKCLRFLLVITTKSKVALENMKKLLMPIFHNYRSPALISVKHLTKNDHTK